MLEDIANTKKWEVRCQICKKIFSVPESLIVDAIKEVLASGSIEEKPDFTTYHICDRLN